MLDILLLRYRDIMPSINTIDEHNAVVKERGRVLWGWWKKGSEQMPDPYLSELAEEMERNSSKSKVFIIDSGTSELYEAELYKIYYDFGGAKGFPDQQELCPAYYVDEPLPAWFELGEIRKVTKGFQELSQYVFSKSNRCLPNSSSCLSEREIGQVVSDVDFLEKNISLWFINRIEDFGLQNDLYALNISNGVWPTNGKYILHLSDIHFGANHGFKNPLGGKQDLVAKQELCDVILEDLKSQGIFAAGIAAVIISGDLTWRADPHEFSNALKFLEKLKNYFGLSNKQIMVVPGNHDIEWIDENGNIDSNAELNYHNFYQLFYNVVPEKSFMRMGKFRINGKVIGIIGVNSCRMESMSNAGYGYVGSEQLNKIQQYLSNNQDIDMAFAVCHHHLLPVNYLEEIRADDKRISMMLDAELVIRTLIANNVKVVLHGHQHQPYYSQIIRTVPEYIDKSGKKRSLKGKLSVVGGGSCGVKQSEINVIGRNTYNLLYFSEDNKLKIKTRIKSGTGIGFYNDEEVEFEM